MANVTTTNPIQIDTTGVLTTNMSTISSFVWSGITTNGHQFVLKDNKGNVIIDLKGGANAPIAVTFCTPLVVAGMNVTTLSSGSVYIYG